MKYPHLFENVNIFATPEDCNVVGVREINAAILRLATGDFGEVNFDVEALNFAKVRARGTILGIYPHGCHKLKVTVDLSSDTCIVQVIP